MANFFKPPGVADGYTEKSPNGLGFVHISLGDSRDVALFGGYASGAPLWVNLNDFDSAACPATCTEKSAQGGTRMFQIRGRGMGSTMLEARLGGRTGPVWDFAQIVVGKAPIIRTGPRLGSDGLIPAHQQSLVKLAMDRAWELNRDARFVETFRDTVSKLSGTTVSSDVYALTLNRIIINLLETSRDPRIPRGLAEEAIDIRAHALSGPAPSVSFRNEPNIWIRSFAFAKGVHQITSCIVHEAAHVAGAAGDAIAEWALNVIHRAARLPR